MKNQPQPEPISPGERLDEAAWLMSQAVDLLRVAGQNLDQAAELLGRTEDAVRQGRTGITWAALTRVLVAASWQSNTTADYLEALDSAEVAELLGR